MGTCNGKVSTNSWANLRENLVDFKIKAAYPSRWSKWNHWDLFKIRNDCTKCWYYGITIGRASTFFTNIAQICWWIKRVADRTENISRRYRDIIHLLGNKRAEIISKPSKCQFIHLVSLQLIHESDKSLLFFGIKCIPVDSNWKGIVCGKGYWWVWWDSKSAGQFERGNGQMVEEQLWTVAWSSDVINFARRFNVCPSFCLNTVWPAPKERQRLKTKAHQNMQYPFALIAYNLSI